MNNSYEVVRGVFHDAAKECGATNFVMTDKWFNALLGIYHDEQYRYFSTMDRIVDWVYRAYEFGWYEDLPETSSVELAIWFSRAIWKPDQEMFENRIGSAKLAHEAMMDMGITNESLRTMIVLFVADHEKAPVKHPLFWSVYHDVQLDWMTTTPGPYNDDVMALREEYSCLNDVEFAEMRSQDLRRLLGKPSMFLTKTTMSSSLQARARENAADELALYNEWLTSNPVPA